MATTAGSWRKPAPPTIRESAHRAWRGRATPETLRAALRQLAVLRSIAIAGQAAAIAIAWSLGVALPVVPMLIIVLALVALNATVWFRLRSPGAPGQTDVATSLLFDLGAFALLLYCSGGAANPFSMLFVLHAALMALLLPAAVAAAGVAAVMACYLALVHLHRQLAMASGAPLSPELLAIGQGLALILTMVVTAWFLMRIVSELRQQDRLLSESIQQALRDEAVLRVGALAAGATHELAAPLTTMAVLAGEIERHADAETLRRDARLLNEQIALCRESLADLTAAAGHAYAVGGGRERLDRFLESIAARCRATHPDANIDCDWNASSSALEVFADHGLRQAVLALLNNAVDASPTDVRFAAWLQSDVLRIRIADRGPGFASDDRAGRGRKFFTTKPVGKGSGLGLVLASRAIQRLGGSLAWDGRTGGGTTVEITLPMATLRIAGSR